MKKLILIFCLLAFAVPVIAQQTMKLGGGEVSIGRNGDIRIQPRSDKGVIVNGKLNACVDAGSTDAYACAPTPSLASYITGQVFWFKAATANTGAATINLSGLGAKTIKKAVGGVTTDLATGDIRANQWVEGLYDGTNVQMLSASGLAPQAALTNPVVGVAASYKIARGVASITGSGDVVTGLTTVVSIVVTPQSDLDGDTLSGCSATIGNQAGAPAAGSVTIKCWKVTTGGAAGNPTLIAADAAKSVNWIAIGL